MKRADIEVPIGFASFRAVEMDFEQFAKLVGVEVAEEQVD